MAWAVARTSAEIARRVAVRAELAGCDMWCAHIF